MDFHRIRLHGPWHIRLLESDVSTNSCDGRSFHDLVKPDRPSISVNLPGEIGDSDQLQSLGLRGADPDPIELLLVRRFNRPTGLVPGQTIVVGCWSDREVVSAWLNDERLLPSRFNFSEPASSCFLLSTASFAAYNSVGLVFRVGRLDRWRIDQVALGLSDQTGEDV